LTRGTVLVVDDEPDIRESLRDALEDEGYSVVTAGNGREALEILSAIERPCALILDIIMPMMSGAEVWETMRGDAELASIPVIVSTSDPTRAPDGAPIMRKPIDLDRLLTMVAGLFDSKTKVDAQAPG
jgi:two-component system, sensor histidine kinase and response regulator